MRRILPDMTDAKTYQEFRQITKTKKDATGRRATGILAEDNFDITTPDIYEDQPVVDVKGLPSGSKKVRVAEGGSIRGRRGDFVGRLLDPKTNAMLQTWIAVRLEEFQKNWSVSK